MRGVELKEFAERWRAAGVVLRRIDPVFYRALLVAAELAALELLDLAALEAFINLPDKLC